MFTSGPFPRRSFGSAFLLALGASLLVGVAGCGQEIISHNAESRQSGLDLYNQNQYADAAGAFRNAARQDPRDYKSLFFLGSCYEKMNEFHPAIEAYKSSLDAQTRTLAGQEDQQGRLRTMDALAALIAKGDTNDAETNLIASRANQTQASGDLFLLARIYRYRGDADSAVEAYNHAALKNPRDFAIVKEFGLYLEQLGQKQRAENELRKAYAMRSTDEDVSAALRRLGIVPGPSLKDQKDLVAPPLPQGPIPEVNLSDIKIFGGNNSAPEAQPAAAASPAPAAPAPRD